MKTNVRPVYAAMSVLLCLTLNVADLHAQDKMNITLGLGFPEMINAGIRYNIGQTQAGMSAGFYYVDHETITTFSVSLWEHFIGSSKLTEMKPWYGRLGVDFILDKVPESSSDKILFLDMRGGREFNFNEHSGVCIDAGIIYKISANSGNSVGQFIYNIMWALPAGGISFFHRF